MTEDLVVIERNIAHYGGILTFDLDEKERSIVKRLLAEAEETLAAAMASRPQRGSGSHATGGNVTHLVDLDRRHASLQPFMTADAASG